MFWVLIEVPCRGISGECLKYVLFRSEKYLPDIHSAVGLFKRLNSYG